MTKQEFEKMTLRNGATISALLYDTIESFYTSENEYHAANGGTDESKQDFCARVFGGKVNTPESILKKITAEAQKENRFALRGCPSATEERLAEMDALIAQHTRTLATMNF